MWLGGMGQFAADYQKLFAEQPHKREQESNDAIRGRQLTPNKKSLSAMV
jgi:hypothetical protein